MGESGQKETEGSRAVRPRVRSLPTKATGSQWFTRCFGKSPLMQPQALGCSKRILGNMGAMLLEKGSMAIRSQNFNIAFFSDNQRPGLYV